MNKYGARKTEVDGILFDSKKEAKYYELYKLQKRAIGSDKIVKIELQPEFTLLEKTIHPATGEKVRGVKYKADFKLTYADGREEIIDVKGMKTDVYKLKKKFLLNKYPNINFKEVY